MITKKRGKKVKKAELEKWVVILGAICLLFFSGKLIFSHRKRIWKKGRLNFVLASEPVLVISLSPREKALTVVQIPENTYVEVTRGFGLYKIESVYPLGQIEGKGGGILAETAQEFLGIPVEAYVHFNNFQSPRLAGGQAISPAKRDPAPRDNFQLNKEDIIGLKKKVTSWMVFLRPQKLIKFLKEDLETNFGFWDIVKIWLNLKKISTGKIKFIDLEERMVLTEFSLPDGGVGKKGDPLLIDNLLAEFFFEPEIRKEGVSVEVLNGTNHPGLGKKAARIITNLGVKVIKVADSEEKVEQCQIKGAGKVLRSFTLSKIKEVFDCQVVEDEKNEPILIIGNDYYKKLFSKD